MKVAISHIAWRPEEEAEIAPLLRDMGVSAIEIAPARVTEPAPEYREFWRRHGITIVGMQALLFGKPHLRVFGSQEEREALLDHLEQVFDLAKCLGARTLVFGSPRNRLRGELSPSEAEDIAASFFSIAGENARRHSVKLCLEPNPAAYGCDFLTNSEEASRLVKRIGSDGIGLHLDGAAMHLAPEDPVLGASLLGKASEHFHVSAPELGPVGSGVPIDYVSVFRELGRSGYDGFLSIEMRAENTGSNIERVRTAIQYTQECLQKGTGAASS